MWGKILLAPDENMHKKAQTKLEATKKLKIHEKKVSIVAKRYVEQG